MDFKKLRRLEQGKMVTGVCAGIGDYFKIDPTIVRLGMAIFALTGVGVVFYIIATIVMPSSDNA